MRSGAATDHVGYFHETAFYDSDEVFVDIVAPFLQDGVDAGEPTVVACSPTNAALLERAVDWSSVMVLPGPDQYARPARTIKDYRRLFGRLAREGAAQIRVVGDVPHPGTGTDWTGWLHYEAAVNDAYAEFPVWGLCPYDLRIAPSAVVEDVCCAHPFVATRHGDHLPNARFEAPSSLLRRRGDGTRPLGPALLTLLDPTAAEARRRVGEAVAPVLGRERVEVVQLVTSELVANALEHGRAPRSLALHLGEGQVTIAVADGGDGPADRLAGWLEPDPLVEHGRGLWIVNQLAVELRSSRGAGFEVQATLAATES